MRYFLVTFLLVMTACSPRYEIKTHYTMPQDIMGQQGVKNCLAEKKVCQTRCDQREERCLATAEKSARDEFHNLSKVYREQLHQYNYEMDRYSDTMRDLEYQENRLQSDVNHYGQKCRTDKNSYECRQLNDVKHSLHRLRDREPKEPLRPSKPSLSREIHEAQKSCANECGCDKAYDTCFSSCGGTVRYEKFCIENCK